MPVPEGWLDIVTFNRNRDAFAEEQLQPYWGRHVAWSLDGTRIVADAATSQELYERMKELGIDPCTVVSSFVPDPFTSYI